ARGPRGHLGAARRGEAVSARTRGLLPDHPGRLDPRHRARPLHQLEDSRDPPAAHQPQAGGALAGRAHPLRGAVRADDLVAVSHASASRGTRVLSARSRETPRTREALRARALPRRLSERRSRSLWFVRILVVEEPSMQRISGSLDEGRITFGEPESEPDEIVDPVCGARMERRRAVAASAYGGRAVFFCS